MVQHRQPRRIQYDMEVFRMAEPESERRYTVDAYGISRIEEAKTVLSDDSRSGRIRNIRMLDLHLREQNRIQYARKLDSLHSRYRNPAVSDSVSQLVPKGFPGRVRQRFGRLCRKRTQVCKITGSHCQGFSNNSSPEHRKTQI